MASHPVLHYLQMHRVTVNQSVNCNTIVGLPVYTVTKSCPKLISGTVPFLTCFVSVYSICNATYPYVKLNFMSMIVSQRMRLPN